MASTKHQKPKDANARSFQPKAGRNSAGYKGKKKHVGLEQGRLPLSTQCKLDKRDLAAQATITVLTQKLSGKTFALEVATKACASYAVGKKVSEISKEMLELFGPKARLGVRAFKEELTYQASKSQVELMLE